MADRAALARWAKARRIGRPLVIALLLVGCIGFFDAVGASLNVYVTFFGALADAPTAEEIHRYEIGAGVAVGCLAAATILCFVLGRWWHMLITTVLLVVVVGGVAVFSVPSGRWYPPEPTREPLPSYYHPCYSGSHDCN